MEIYVLDKNDMSLIPDFILKKVLERIAVLREPDRPMLPNKIQEVKESMVKWEKYKYKCVETLFKEKAQYDKHA